MIGKSEYFIIPSVRAVPLGTSGADIARRRLGALSMEFLGVAEDSEPMDDRVRQVEHITKEFVGGQNGTNQNPIRR